MRVSVVGAVVIDGPTQRSAPTGAIVICRRGGPLCPPATAYVPPGSPSSVMGLRPCHLLPCGAKAIAVLMLGLIALWRSPHPPQRAHWGTFSQEKAVVSNSSKFVSGSGRKNPGAADFCAGQGPVFRAKKFPHPPPKQGGGAGSFPQMWKNGQK